MLDCACMVCNPKGSAHSLYNIGVFENEDTAIPRNGCVHPCLEIREKVVHKRWDGGCRCLLWDWAFEGELKLRAQRAGGIPAGCVCFIPRVAVVVYENENLPPNVICNKGVRCGEISLEKHDKIFLRKLCVGRGVSA